ncbi:MAG: DMT family transporter [Gammaproteobacteria bacterium]|nr:DMT family transporter [Gammaproteobacteria bacterium]
MSNHRFFPYVLITVAGLIWGATFSLALIATGEGAHPLAISAWQVVVTGIFFVGFCGMTNIPVFRFRNLRHYTVLAVIGITAPNLAYYYAAPHLSAGILSITVSTVPLLTYAFMLFLHYESILVKRVFGILLGMVAILLLVLPDQGIEGNDANLWILLALLSAVMYTVENVYIGHGIDDIIDVRELLCGSNFVAFFMQFPLAWYLGVAEPASWLLTVPGLALAGLGIGSGIAYTLFFYSIKTSGAVFASQCAYIVTLSGVIWGIIVFSEEHSIWVWSSLVVLMVGLFLVAPNKKQDNQVANATVVSEHAS